jgi:putative transposase
MARQARIVVENTPHHIMQRGIDGEPIFFKKEHFQHYLDLLEKNLKASSMDLLGYCLLPNQIHLIVTPKQPEDLARIIGETHRLYTKNINEDQSRSGPLFQNRFFSYPMDEQNSLRAARYIETLPITAKITQQPEKYLWSSAKFRIKVKENSILKPFSSFHSLHNWSDYLERPMAPEEIKAINLHLQTGRPRGSDLFLDNIEEKIGRPVRPKKRGRKPKQQQQKQEENKGGFFSAFPLRAKRRNV